MRTALACWGLEELADSARVIVSELVTNAVLHGRPAAATAEEPGRCWVWVTVVDSSPCRPVRRTAAVDAESGRGLAVVEGLADRLAVRAEGSGKSVRAELTARDLSSPPPAG